MNVFKSRYLFFVLLILAVVFCFMFLFKIMIYIAIAAIISLIGQPFMKFFKRTSYRFKLKPNYALFAALTMLAIYSLLFSLFSFLLPVVFYQLKTLVNVDWNKAQVLFKPLIDSIENSIGVGGSNYHTKIVEGINNYINNYINFDNAGEILNTALSLTGQLVAGVFAISFISFFLLKDQKLLQRYVLLIFPTDYEAKLISIMSDAKTMLSSYFIGLFFDVLTITAMISIGLSIIGIQNTLIIGVIAGLLNVIPYIGPLIGGGLGIVISLSSNPNIINDGFGIVPKIILVFVIVQLIDMVLVQPYIFSNSVKAHPLEIFLVILVAGMLGGITAMMVAIPVYTVLRIIAREFFSQFKLVKSITHSITKDN